MLNILICMYNNNLMNVFLLYKRLIADFKIQNIVPFKNIGKLREKYLSKILRPLTTNKSWQIS